MIARAGSGWQTVLADLSLILFMITASAASEPLKFMPSAPAPILPAPIMPALGEPVAVWRAAPGGTDLRTWLGQSAPDPRLRLTIVAAASAQQAAFDLAAQADRPARIILEPGPYDTPFAALTYDQPGTAQGLHLNLPKSQLKEPVR